jgi:hypothetical protein
LALVSVMKIMRRGPFVAVAAILIIELAYILYATAPDLNPSPGCYPGSVDACVFRPFPWLWMGLAALLFLNAAALLLRKRLGIALGFLTQAVLLLGLARNMSQEIGWSLSQGSLWSGIASWYPDLLFTILVLCAVVGPALTLLVMIIGTPVAAKRRAARIAALLLSIQLVGLVSTALISFPAAFRGCDYTGPGAVVVGDSPGTCPDFANLDFGILFAMAIPAATILLSVCIGVWFGRHWALSAGIVWQATLALVLIVLRATLWDDTNQNYWYESFPLWLSPRYLADALIFLAPVPALAALLASQPSVLSGWQRLRAADPVSPLTFDS